MNKKKLTWSVPNVSYIINEKRESWFVGAGEDIPSFNIGDSVYLKINRLKKHKTSYVDNLYFEGEDKNGDYEILFFNKIPLIKDYKILNNNLK